MSPPQCADSPNAKEPRQVKPAEDDAAPSEADTAERVEAGAPEEPCFYGHGPAWDNRHWRGWKPRNTPRMPPKGCVAAEMQQSPPPSATTQVAGQLQAPPRGLDHEGRRNPTDARLKLCLAAAVGWIPCLSGFRHLGCPW